MTYDVIPLLFITGVAILLPIPTAAHTGDVISLYGSAVVMIVCALYCAGRLEALIDPPVDVFIWLTEISDLSKMKFRQSSDKNEDHSTDVE